MNHPAPLILDGHEFHLLPPGWRAVPSPAPRAALGGFPPRAAGSTPDPVGAERPSIATVFQRREVDVADCLQGSHPAASAPTVLPQTSRSHSGGVVERDTYVSPTARGRRTG